MRQTLAVYTVLFASLVMAGHAQTGTVLTTVGKDGRTPVSNVRIDLVANGQPMTLGTTDAAGRLQLDPAASVDWTQYTGVEQRCPVEEKEPGSVTRGRDERPIRLTFMPAYRKPFGPVHVTAGPSIPAACTKGCQCKPLPKPTRSQTRAIYSA